MDINTEVTLEQVYDGITSAISAQFPGVYVEAEREDRKPPSVPAILVEMSEMLGEANDDPGTGQQGMQVRFEALVIMGFRQPGKSAKREVRQLAAALSAFVRLQRWGCPIGPAIVLGAHPDHFDPELDQFECWRVEWEQCIDLGATVWTNEGTQPTVVTANGNGEAVVLT